MVGGWWLVVGGGWLVVGKRWLVGGGWGRGHGYEYGTEQPAQGSKAGLHSKYYGW